MKLFSFGKKKSEEEKAREAELKQQQKAEKARLQELKKQQKAHDAQARKAVKDEQKRVKREEKEWKKQEKALRDREKAEQKEVENREKQARKVVEKREKQERKRVKKLERQHATTRRREERRRRKALIRNRRKMRKLRKLQKKQRRAQDPSVHQQQIDELLAETASGQSPLSQDPVAVVASSSSMAATAATAAAAAAASPAFKKRANCFTCRSKFRVNRIRYHCRNCGESCCKKCLSDVKRPIPWQGKHKPQKICVMCDTLVFSDRTAASLAVENAAASASNNAIRVPSRSNSVEVTPEVDSPPASSSSASSRPASGSGISVSLASRSNLRRNDSGSSMKSKKPSLWTLPIRPLLKRKRSVEQLRNRQLDFELQLEKAAQLSRQGQKTLEIELQPQHSTLSAPLARVS